MFFFAALLMSTLVFGVVAQPLLRPARRDAAARRADGRRREELRSQRDAAYGAIRELEFEYQLGNLSEHDHEDLRARYRDRAAGVLQRLDALEREEAASHRQRRRRAPHNGGGQDEIEQAVALLRQQREGKAPSPADSRSARAQGGTCPACHEPVDQGDRFCARCGERLKPV